MHHSRCDERPPPSSARTAAARALLTRQGIRATRSDLPIRHHRTPGDAHVQLCSPGTQHARGPSITVGSRSSPGRRARRTVTPGRDVAAAERLNRRPCSAMPEPLQAAPLILTPPRTASSAFPNLCQVAEHTGRYRIVHLERGQREAAVEPSRCSKLSLQSSIGPLQADRGVARHDPSRLRLGPRSWGYQPGRPPRRPRRRRRRRG